jgi:CheY-like chemotaxis protein
VNPKKTILIVDDSRLTRFMLKSLLLKNYPDWEVLDAANADEALKIVEENRVDFITLDVNMPGMDGVTLGTELRKRFPGTPIALLTANIQQATQDKAKAAGLNFLPKPLNEELILEFVANGEVTE